MAIAYISRLADRLIPKDFFFFRGYTIKRKEKEHMALSRFGQSSSFPVPGCRNADRFLILFVFFRTIRRSLPHTHTHQFIDPFFPFILHSHRHHSLCK